MTDTLPTRTYPPEEQSHHGQARMAYRLATDYAGRLMYVYGIGWHYWDGARWAEDDKGCAKRAVLDVLRRAMAESVFGDKELRKEVAKCESSSGINGVLDIAGALRPLAATVDALDADPYLLNVANGTLDLRTLELKTHDPTDRITKVTNAAYQADARSDQWDKFLLRILPETDVREYYQRLVGLSLLGVVREHIFAIATGVGANGKGTSYNAILHALGDYGHVAESDLFMQAKSNANAASPAMYALRGKRLVVVSETERDHKLATALMKNLTGGDPITARPLYGKPITFDPSHTSLMVTNWLPKVAGNDPAAWRRIRVIPFDVVIPKSDQDGQLGERLKLDADAILTWAVTGWADYQERDGMGDPTAVTRATARYLEASDAVARFITECCHTGPRDYVFCPLKAMFSRWERWAETEDVQKLGKSSFTQEMERHGWVVDEERGHQRVYRGIGLTSDEEEDAA